MPFGINVAPELLLEPSDCVLSSKIGEGSYGNYLNIVFYYNYLFLFFFLYTFSFSFFKRIYFIIIGEVWKGTWGTITVAVKQLTLNTVNKEVKFILNLFVFF